jgi:hypothetical protein
MRHFAAGVEDLNCWQTHPRAVAILQNKETGYAVTEDFPGVVILHGHGRYVEQYTRIGWVRDAQLVTTGVTLMCPAFSSSAICVHAVSPPARS